MKKNMIILLLALICSISIQFSFADVFYDEDSDMYVSTSEKDGTIAMNGYILDSEGEILGTNSNVSYLENLVPTVEELKNGKEKTEKIKPKELSFGLTNTIENEKVFSYTPQSKWLMFKFDLKQNQEAIIKYIEITDETGNVVARASNLNSEKKYKLTNDLKGSLLSIKITYITTSDDNFELILNSSNDKKAEEKAVYPSVSPLGYVTTSTVPKNIDGNQGQFLAAYTMLGTRYCHSKFMSSTNNMSSLNIAHYFDSMLFDYALNIPIGTDFVTGTYGGGTVITIKLSTNSTPGQATLYLFEIL